MFGLLLSEERGCVCFAHRILVGKAAVVLLAHLVAYVRHLGTLDWWNYIDCLFREYQLLAVGLCIAVELDGYCLVLAE